MSCLIRVFFIAHQHTERDIDIPFLSDVEKTILDKAIDQWRKRLVNAAHRLNRHTVLNYIVLFLSILAASSYF